MVSSRIVMVVQKRNLSWTILQNNSSRGEDHHGRAADLLGHAGRIWDHFVGYAKKNEMYDPIFRAEGDAMAAALHDLLADDDSVKVVQPGRV
jgi:hypothetical protein